MAKDASTILLANLGSIIGQSLLYGKYIGTSFPIKFANDVYGA